MDLPSIFSSTLGLASPWNINHVEVSQDHPRLDIYIGCSKSVSMPCPLCGKEATICDESEQSWHHSNFFNKEAYLHVTVPVVRCHSLCGRQKMNVPWSRPGSRFVLIKEFCVELAPDD